MSLIKSLIVVASFTVFSGCAPINIEKPRDDLDNIVSAKGIPLVIKEDFRGGQIPFWDITLFYNDGMLTFQGTEDKSHFFLLSSTVSANLNVKQSPIPLWFKAKYPTLSWSNIPIK